MTDSIINTLRALKDVHGIVGSFVVHENGVLVAREMPSIFTNELLSDATPRIARLGETFESASVEFDTCVLRFSDHLLYVRKLLRGFLCVLTHGDVNSPALKMAVNLAQRRISPELETIAAPTLDSPESVAAPAPVQSASPPVQAGPKRPPRMYRGQLVED